MKEYEINNNTVALIFENNGCRVYENGKDFFINMLPNEIIKHSCEYFGSSYKGRVDGTRYMTGITHKSPIIIEESMEIIFFPVSSPRLNECSWIRSKYIKSYKNVDKSCLLTTFNDENIILNCSTEIINNQILRSCRLESVLRYKKCKFSF